MIKQSTGEDWENAKISLSTAQPSVGGEAPTLPTKIVRFIRPLRNLMKARSLQMNTMSYSSVVNDVSRYYFFINLSVVVIVLQYRHLVRVRMTMSI